MATSNPRIHQLTIPEFEAMFPDDDACKEYLVVNRWPDGVMCPRCGAPEAYDLPNKPFHWQCHQCAPQGYRFSVLVGTVFENTKYSMREWFRVIHMMMTAKKGVSALQIHRQIGTGSYRTAWSMCHRIRVGLSNVEFRQLVGMVEVDETFVGGKAKNKHKGPGGRGDSGGTGGHGKAIIVGAVKRKGNVIARVIDSVDAKTLNAFVEEAVSHKVTLISTDEHRGYWGLKERFPHRVVRHGAGEYVHGNVHTNTIEGFWSLVKRGIIGTYHKVSRKYLPLYVAEFEFRYNNRKNEDIFGAALRTC